MAKQMKTMDGNYAAAYASYAFTEAAAIFPITPSSPMAEHVDEWSAQGKKNIFGQTPRVVELQSEAGAAGTLHGMLQAGILATTYTASQGLLLMIPNLYKWAGELLPAVLHVSARAIATHALSIFGDHQDVMACRQTGVAMLCSSNVQEAMDLGCLSHLCAIKGSLPFLHFFDGFRTSHEIKKIEVLEYEDMAKLIDREALDKFRKRALNPEHPVARGSSQNPDIYFQGREAANPFYDRLPQIVQDYMDKLKEICGREYHLFDYYGCENPENIIVAMGSVCETAEEVADYLNASGGKTGVLKVRLYRPFSVKHFLNTLPKSVKRIAVLDMTKEPGSIGEPLYLDILKAVSELDNPPLVIGGRYGLGSKDTTPSQILSVFRNLEADSPKDRFTIGIVDDVTHTSLNHDEMIDTIPEGTISCKFWGLGSDGTVGANKTAIKIIGDHTPLYAQGYFSYDSKKSGGTTVSHLRFGKKPIKSPYLVSMADYIACHNKSFIYNHNVAEGLKKGGIFLLNCPWSQDELDNELPADLKRYIAENNIRFYIIDAVKIAGEIGLGNRINMIMQSAFFKLTNVIPPEEAAEYLKKSIEEMYGRKGEKVVSMNKAAVDRGMEEIHEVTVPSSWKDAVDNDLVEEDVPDFVTKIQRPMERHQGDTLPVSAFKNMEDGTFPMGTTSYEKRGIAVTIPEWQPDKCIQCNQCAFVCPHAVIRAFLLDEDEAAAAPEGFIVKPAIGKGLEGLKFRIQISPLDCTGCGSCADTCPAPGKALIMQPAEEQIKAQAKNWEFSLKLKTKDNIMDKTTLKGSQFARPLFEFHGACPGCGETPYIRLITQLFGDRMIIANATGCSSIYGLSAPSVPYTTNSDGKGPAWANSLFEDNAEFGYGMKIGVDMLRDKLKALMEDALNEDIPDELKSMLTKYLEVMENVNATKEIAPKLISLLEKEKSRNSLLEEIYKLKDYLIKKSQWIIGGDGWAYDIGYGGLDHVLASGENVNVLVLDTEIYSNTGGQSSKATPTGASAKFAFSGKKLKKKDLGLMAMSYGYVYVAQIAMGANMMQTLKAITEAEAYDGPSLIIAYSPCISHGIKTGMGTSIAEEKKAVAAGYWQLYRFNPKLKAEGKNPFILDSKDPSENFQDFIKGEIRYSALQRSFPDRAEKLFALAEENAAERLGIYKQLSKMKLEE